MKLKSHEFFYQAIILAVFYVVGFVILGAGQAVLDAMRGVI